MPSVIDSCPLNLILERACSSLPNDSELALLHSEPKNEFNKFLCHPKKKGQKGHVFLYVFGIIHVHGYQNHGLFWRQFNSRQSIHVTKKKHSDKVTEERQTSKRKRDAAEVRK